MAKSKGRYLADLIGATGLVRSSKSDLAGSDGIIELAVLPSLPNSKLTNSSITLGAISLTGALTTNSTIDGIDIATRDALLTSTISDVALKATLASPSLTGVPVAPTAASNTNTTQLATTAFVQTEITDLIGGAPGALDTLNELAASINDEASYAAGITTALGLKAPLASPDFSGTVGIGVHDLGTGLHIKTSDSGATVNSNGDELVIESSGSAGISVLTGTANDGNIFFGDSGGNVRGKVSYSHNGDYLTLMSSGAMRLETGGAVTIIDANNSAGDLGTVVGPGNIPNITIQNTSTTDNNLGGIFFKDDGDIRAAIVSRFTSHASDEAQLRFATSSGGLLRERMIISETGNISINTTTSAKFEINHGAQTGALGLSTATAFKLSQATGAPAVGNIVQMSMGYGNTYSNISIAAIRTSAAAYGTDDLVFAVKDGTTDKSPPERMRITSAGNVGIGTITPQAPFHVSTSSSKISEFTRTGSGTFDLTISDVGTGTGQLWFNAQTNDYGFAFRPKDGSGNVTNALYIAPDGKIGIGTTAPSYLLDIDQANVGGVTDFRLFNSATTNAASGARGIISVANSSVGDPRLVLGITGVQEYCIGIDNSDSDLLKINNGSDPSASTNYMKIGAAVSGVAVTGKIVVSATDSQFYNRLIVKNGSDGLYLGQWDTVNNRIESDANRPLTIQAYHAGGITLGISGNPKLVVTSAGVAVTGTITSTGNTEYTGYIFAKSDSRLRLYNSANNNYSEIYNGSSDSTSRITFRTGAGERLRLEDSGLTVTGSLNTSTTNGVGASITCDGELHKKGEYLSALGAAYNGSDYLARGVSGVVLHTYSNYESSWNSTTETRDIFEVSNDTSNWADKYIMIEVFHTMYAGGGYAKYYWSNQYGQNTLVQVEKNGYNSGVSAAVSGATVVSGNIKKYTFQLTFGYYQHSFTRVTSNMTASSSITAANQLRFL